MIFLVQFDYLYEQALPVTQKERKFVDQSQHFR